MRVIVTRPEREARACVESLVERGLDAISFPLIDIRPVADAAPVRAAWARLGYYAALMFVSGAAVDYFFALKPAGAGMSSAPNAPGMRFWGPGPGTAAALQRQGVERDRVDVPARDAGQFDSEALWDVVQTQVKPGDRVLVVRGGDAPRHEDAPGSGGSAGHGREWLAQRLQQSGAQVEFVQAYWRGAPVLGEAQCIIGREAATDGSVWLFTSAQAIANLRVCLPHQSWAGARAVATHPRIAAAARVAGFGVVWESRPGISELLASIESIG
jgi:uroporphyrinogen-III synthase